MSELSKNYIPYTEEAQVRIKDALVTHYFSGNVEGKQDDLQDHLTRSVEINRNTIIPWIDAHYKLHGSKLLEIGSGTGCSTLAYSEQGAEVTGVDILESSIKVAEVRCNAYGYYPNFIIGNATTIDAMLPEKKFGIAVFHASLEHMILEERIDSLKAVWEKIDKGGILVIVEAPNRLWHTDNHTSLLPFFHWLPDDLAFEYAKYSSRKGFGDIYDNWEKQKLHFLRRGRGVSFHEFEMAFGNLKNIRAGKSLHEFYSCPCPTPPPRPIIRRVLSSVKRNLRRMVRDILTPVSSNEEKVFSDELYVEYLKTLQPGFPDGFYREFLFMIFYKD